MHTAFLRTGDTLIAPEPVATGKGLVAFLARILEELVHASANTLPSSDGQLPREWFKYPPF